MSAVAEHASRVRLSDPRPARCAACYGSDSERYVDFQAAFNGGAVIEEGSGAVRDSIDELHLCEACVRSACETLGFKPELHRRQVNEIRRLELKAEHYMAAEARKDKEIEHWRQRCRELEDGRKR